MRKKLSVEDIAFIRDSVIEAGDSAGRFQKGEMTVQRKKDRSIVTEADHMVQGFLMERIKSRIENIGFIHEEDFDRRDADIKEERLYCVIDPIDGTAMFSMYLPIWCVSVGIMLGYRPLYGFVYSPGASMIFHNDDEYSYLNGERVRVDKNMTIDRETNIFYSAEIYGKFHMDFRGKVRNLGSTAFHACLTIDNARNRVLAFMGRSYLWDWAGALPIINRAGGCVNYIDGKDLDMKMIIENRYELTDYAVAYNSGDFDEIRKIFRPI